MIPSSFPYLYSIPPLLADLSDQGNSSTDGRFSAQDWKGFSTGDSNLYRYTRNDPVLYNDPSGLQQSAVPAPEGTGDEQSYQVFLGGMDLIGKIWGVENTVIGLLAGASGWVYNWLAGQQNNTSIGHNGIQFTNVPFIPGNGALTLGNVILYGTNPNDPTPNGTIGSHEEQHTYQSQWLGPLYIPSHIIAGLWSELTTGDWHDNNILEIGPQDPNGPHPWPSGSQWWQMFESTINWWGPHLDLFDSFPD